MKRAWVVAAMVVFTLFIFSTAWAHHWAVVVNIADQSEDTLGGSIFMVRIGTTPPQVYGPFLEGQLGNVYGGLLDVAIIPGNKYALVSNFGDSKIFRVDISDPTAPVVAGRINIGFLAEDIAIAPNGTWAAVTDGGFASSVAFIDLVNFNLNGVYDLGGLDAQCVAIAPDSKTVVLGDYWGGNIVWGEVNAAKNGFEFVESISCIDPENDDNSCWPVNVDFAPNGTAIVLSAFNNIAHVVYMPTPGTIVQGDPFLITPLPGSLGAT